MSEAPAHLRVTTAIYEAIKHQCAIGAGECETDADTCLLTVAADLDLGGIALAVLEATQPTAPAVGDEVEDFLSQLRRVNGERYAAWVHGSGEDPLYLSNEFGGEAGEVLNIVKKLEREKRGWRGSRSTPDALADEIADCVICLDNLARGYGIDLAESVARKFNETSEKNDFPHRLAAIAAILPEGLVREAPDYPALQAAVTRLAAVRGRDAVMGVFERFGVDHAARLAPNQWPTAIAALELAYQDIPSSEGEK